MYFMSGESRTISHENVPYDSDAASETPEALLNSTLLFATLCNHWRITDDLDSCLTIILGPSETIT